MIDFVFSPFELRMRYIGTTLPQFSEMGHSRLNPSCKVKSTTEIRTRAGSADCTHLTGAIDDSATPLPLQNVKSTFTLFKQSVV